MKKTFSNSALTLEPLGLFELKIALLEPTLVVSAVFFWIAALPFVVLAWRCVEIWDTLTALKSVPGFRSNPLILRHGLTKSAAATRSSTQTAER